MANIVGNESPLLFSNTNSEAILYSLLEKANLTQYFYEFISQGGDDMKQLCDANENEFLEIMVLVGMASKPLHVRRLQKVLIEWSNNPDAFQPSPNTPPLRNANQHSTAYSQFFNAYNSGFSGSTTNNSTNNNSTNNNSTNNNSTNSLTTKLPNQNNQLSSLDLSNKNIFNAHQDPENSMTPATDNHLKVYLTSPNKAINHTSHLSQSAFGGSSHSGHHSHIQLSGSHIETLAKIASTTARDLPNYAPKPLNMKKPIDRLIDEALNMNADDHDRLELFRKYGAIYGRFDSKRSKDKQLNFHELCVNEAAAQLALHRPSLLTRREELFLLARQVVKESGFQWSRSNKSKENTATGSSQAMMMMMMMDDSSLSIKQESNDDNRYDYNHNSVHNNNNNNYYQNNSTNNNDVGRAVYGNNGYDDDGGENGYVGGVSHNDVGKDFNNFNNTENSSSINTTNNDDDEDEDDGADDDDGGGKNKKARLSIITALDEGLDKNNTNNTNNNDDDDDDDDAGDDNSGVNNINNNEDDDDDDNNRNNNIASMNKASDG